MKNVPVKVITSEVKVDSQHFKKCIERESLLGSELTY